MEDKLKCPICCNDTFESKESLREHLTNILNNINCPVCNNSLPTLESLVDHLTDNNCQREVSRKNLKDATQLQIQFEYPTGKDGNEIEVIKNQTTQDHINSIQNLGTQVINAGGNKVFVEFLSKPLTKTCLTQELKLVNEDGESRYMLVNDTDSGLNEVTVVTKQNNDGTISLTTVNDMKLEPDSLLASTENAQEDNQEEIYSCNTCGVSFVSVFDHIQNYHNDQVVVVEEPIEEGDNGSDMDSVGENDTACDKQISRRVITETGDIVETPVTDDSMENQQTTDVTQEEETAINNIAGTTRYVQIGNASHIVTKDVEHSKSQERLTFHKAIVTKMRIQNGSTVNMYFCQLCNVYATSIEELSTRQCKSEAIKPVMPVSYECEDCNTVFFSNKSLKLHKRMHDPLKSRPIEPPIENKDGTKGTNMRYNCQICDKSIPIDYKQVHLNSHKTTNKLNCDVCNKKFTSNEYLQMHMNVHNVVKTTVDKQDTSLPYNCSYCNRRFARPHEKVKHERIHTGEKPHSCEICGKSFRVSYCLTLHMRTHTGARPYSCPHCGKRFKAHSVYNHHLLTHSDVRAYKCPYCPKAFKTSVQLAGHKNSHTKPFSCKHCNRPFASLYAVRVHSETHARQNNLKFSCAMCGASYARAFALKDHIKQVHKREVDATDILNGDEDDWVMKEADISVLNNSLSREDDDLAINGNELIVP